MADDLQNYKLQLQQVIKEILLILNNLKTKTKKPNILSYKN